MRQGKDHMEIRSIDNFSAAAVHPELFIDSLAVGTITIPAGIIVGLRMSAFRADTDIAAAFFDLIAGFSIAGYINAHIFRRIFKRYIPE